MSCALNVALLMTSCLTFWVSKQDGLFETLPNSNSHHFPRASQSVKIRSEASSVNVSQVMMVMELFHAAIWTNVYPGVTTAMCVIPTDQFSNSNFSKILRRWLIFAPMMNVGYMLMWMDCHFRRLGPLAWIRKGASNATARPAHWEMACLVQTWMSAPMACIIATQITPHALTLREGDSITDRILRISFVLCHWIAY